MRFFYRDKFVGYWANSRDKGITYEDVQKELVKKYGEFAKSAKPPSDMRDYNFVFRDYGDSTIVLMKQYAKRQAESAVVLYLPRELKTSITQDIAKFEKESASEDQKVRKKALDSL